MANYTNAYNQAQLNSAAAKIIATNPKFAKLTSAQLLNLANGGARDIQDLLNTAAAATAKTAPKPAAPVTPAPAQKTATTPTASS